MLKLTAIKKSFPIADNLTEDILKGLDLHIKAGSFTVIYGPSGCGKTTLLNLISGLDRDYSGDILYRHQKLADLTKEELTHFRKENIGFVFQHFNLIAHMSVLDNVYVPMYLNGQRNAENLAKATASLTLVGLKDYLTKDVTRLSGGQKQRVAIARALANDPDLIIADEPTGSLDTQAQSHILAILKELTTRGKTVIIVTHNEAVKAYADQIVHIQDGAVLTQTYQGPDLESSSLPYVKASKNHFKLIKAFKIAYANFTQRKWRNLMIALATAIGLTGILIAFGLGSGIIDLIQEEFATGAIPSQIQVSLSPNYAGATLNQEDQRSLSEIIGPEQIKYLESPLVLSMESLEIADFGKFDFSERMPSYSQIVSLYQNPGIKVVANTATEILVGAPYTDPLEIGLTLPVSFLTDLNDSHQTQLVASDLIGKIASLELVEFRSEGPVYGTYQTPIIRIIKDDFFDTNSFMSDSETKKALGENQFTTNHSFILLELHNPESNETTIERISENQKYLAFSQTGIMAVIINFIKIIQGLLIFLSSQAVIVAIVMISVILYINIIERRKEIGVMKAIGYQNKEINLIFAVEGLLITFIALLLGIIASLTIGTLTNVVVATHFPQLTKVFSLNLSAISYTTVLAFLMAVAASGIPMLKVGKLDPAEAIRSE